MGGPLDIVMQDKYTKFKYIQILVNCFNLSCITRHASIQDGTAEGIPSDVVLIDINGKAGSGQGWL